MATADQTVGAVLDAVGKRYLVEHTEAEDGSWWADRYSDGFVVQSGTQTGKLDALPEVTLPIEMKNENYFATSILPYSGSREFFSPLVKQQTPSAVQFFYPDTREFTMKWFVCG